MEYYICHIDQARELFGEDKTLSKPKQISSWARQILIQKIKEKGFHFNCSIETTLRGKPFFVFNKDLHFSISHTKEYIAIIISDRPIGIDIETRRKYNKLVVDRFFHPKEIELLDRVEDSYKEVLFTKIWTLKEAYVKCLGTGIANSFEIFYVNPLYNPPKIQNNTTEVEIYSYFIPEKDLYISICKEK